MLPLCLWSTTNYRCQQVTLITYPAADSRPKSLQSLTFVRTGQDLLRTQWRCPFVIESIVNWGWTALSPLNIHWVYAASLKRPIFLYLCRLKLVWFGLAFESWLIRFVGSPLLPTLTINAGQTNHWVGSPSLKIQSSLRLGQPHPAFSMQTIINYLIVKYDQIIWGGKYCTQANMLLFIHASVWRYQNFRYQIFLVPVLIFFRSKILRYHPKKNLNISGKGGNDHPCLYVHLQWQ